MQMNAFSIRIALIFIWAISVCTCLSYLSLRSPPHAMIKNKLNIICTYISMYTLYRSNRGAKPMLIIIALFDMHLFCSILHIFRFAISTIAIYVLFCLFLHAMTFFHVKVKNRSEWLQFASVHLLIVWAGLSE